MKAFDDSSNKNYSFEGNFEFQGKGGEKVSNIQRKSDVGDYH